jgi:uncharacterized repeat protein (TIGR01451 family)
LDPAFVFITVSDVIWFVNNSASGSTNVGTFSNPFTSITSLNSAQGFATTDVKPGDPIFIYQGTSTYTDGPVLQDAQVLLGQGVDLLAQLSSLLSIVPPAFSDLTASPPFLLRPTLTDATGDGIRLGENNVVRGLNVGNTPGGSGIVDDGTNAGTVTIDTLAISGTGGGIEINNGGTLVVTLDSLSASSSTDEGIHLTGVSGFFTVSAGTISTTSVPGVDIDGTSSLALNVTLDSISASSAANGILVQDTSGSFTVTGSGSTDGSGGIISTITNRGASFINTTGISLSNMTFDISTSAQQGINGLNVTNFTLADSTVTGCGNEVNEGCLRIVNLSGTASINNSNLSFPAERVAQIENTGVTLTLTVNNSTFRDTQSSGLGADGLEITSDGSSNTTIDIVNSNFLRNRTNGLQVFSEGTSFVNVDVTGSTFDRGTGIGIGMDLAADDSATLHFNVIGNPLINSRGSNAVNIFSDGSATVQGRINDNPDIQAGGCTDSSTCTSGFGIRAQANTNSNMTLEIDNNTISNIGWDAGIQVISRLAGTNRLDATINNNNITVDPNSNSLYDIWVQAGSSQAGENNTTCADVTNNTASGNGSAAFRVREAGGTVLLQGFNTNATTTWNNNGNTPTGSVSESPSAGSASSGTCDTVSHPMASLTPAGTKFFVNNELKSPPIVKGDRNFRDSLTSLIEPLANLLAGVDFTSFISSIRENAAVVVSTLADIVGPTPAYASGESINLSLGDMNPGQVVVITFEVIVDTTIPPNVTQVCNQGLFTSTNHVDVLTDDPDVVGTPDPTCTDVPQADLRTEKIDSTDPVAPNEAYIYSVTVFNDGPSTTQDVVVMDTLPVGVTYISDDCGLSGTPGPTVTWTIGSLANGASAVCNITVTAPGSPGTVTNNASVTSTTHDPDTGNNSASEGTLVLPPIDLAITKDNGTTTSVPGTGTTYTIMVTNNGPTAVTGATVNDNFPAELTNVSWTCSASGGATCSASGSGNINDSVDIPVGDSVTYIVNADIKADASGSLANTSSVTPPANVRDTNPGNDNATDTDSLTPQADLSIIKSDNADPVIVGDNIIYTTTVNNNGPSDAQNVVATDALPGSVTLVSTNGCAEDPNGVPTCSLGSIATGGSAFYTVEVTTSSDGTITNSVTASASTADPVSGNNSASENTIVNPPNQPPEAEAGGPEQPAATLVYEWDLDGDGTFGEVGAAAERGDEIGVNPTFSAVGLDGPTLWTVALLVTDDGGLTDSDRPRLGGHQRAKRSAGSDGRSDIAISAVQ